MNCKFDYDGFTDVESFGLGADETCQNLEDTGLINRWSPSDAIT